MDEKQLHKLKVLIFNGKYLFSFLHYNIVVPNKRTTETLQTLLEFDDESDYSDLLGPSLSINPTPATNYNLFLVPDPLKLKQLDNT